MRLGYVDGISHRWTRLTFKILVKSFHGLTTFWKWFSHIWTNEYSRKFRFMVIVVFEICRITPRNLCLYFLRAPSKDDESDLDSEHSCGGDPNGLLELAAKSQSTPSSDLSSEVSSSLSSQLQAEKIRRIVEQANSLKVVMQGLPSPQQHPRQPVPFKNLGPENNKCDDRVSQITSVLLSSSQPSPSNGKDKVTEPTKKNEYVLPESVPWPIYAGKWMYAFPFWDCFHWNIESSKPTLSARCMFNGDIYVYIYINIFLGSWLTVFA